MLGIVMIQGSITSHWCYTETAWCDGH